MKNDNNSKNEAPRNACGVFSPPSSERNPLKLNMKEDAISFPARRRGYSAKEDKNLARSLPAFRPDLKSRPAQLFTHERLYNSKKVTLLDALDRVIDKGAYVDGELLLRVADIDLVFIGLRLIVTSVSRAERLRNEGSSKGQAYGVKMGAQGRTSIDDFVCIRKLEEQLRDIEASIPKIIDAGNPEKAEQGIAKLVLTLVKLISKLLEREAVRRVDTGTLSETEIQKLGLTFKVLEKKIQEMKMVFGIKEELNLELGPLGNLL